MALLGASLRTLTDARPMDVSIVDGTGAHVTSFATPTPPANATLTSVVTSTTSAVLAALNTSRRQLIIVNDSNKVLYIAFAATATSTAYTVQLGGGATYVSPLGGYTGVVSGILQAATGNARVTEVTV